MTFIKLLLRLFTSGRSLDFLVSVCTPTESSISSASGNHLKKRETFVRCCQNYNNLKKSYKVFENSVIFKKHVISIRNLINISDSYANKTVIRTDTCWGFTMRGIQYWIKCKMPDRYYSFQFQFKCKNMELFSFDLDMTISIEPVVRLDVS